MGHTDVVPVNPPTWTRDPFGGELVNGEVWGRGALDMLNLTASQAVALKTLARRGWRPRGTLVYLACADEEAGGALGAGHVCERHWDSLRRRLSADRERRHGQPRHARPARTSPCTSARRAWPGAGCASRARPATARCRYGADNALVKAAQVVTRLADYRPSPYVDELWSTLRRLARRRRRP